MARSRPSAFVPGLLAILPIALMAAGCGSSPEQQLLQKYFQASRLRDNGTLANIATVSFSPTEQGSVQSFSIVDEGTEQRRPLKLRELAAAEEAALKADEDFGKRKKAYQDSNLTAIERVIKAEAARAPLKGADVQVRQAWTQLNDEQQLHAKALAEARQALSTEKSLTDASVYDQRSPIDATQFDGQLLTKDMTIKAKVRSPQGADEEKTLKVRFTKADLTNGPAGKTVEGRWIIANIGENLPPA